MAHLGCRLGVTPVGLLIEHTRNTPWKNGSRSQSHNKQQLHCRPSWDGSGSDWPSTGASSALQLLINRPISSCSCRCGCWGGWGCCICICGCCSALGELELIANPVSQRRTNCLAPSRVSTREFPVCSLCSLCSCSVVSLAANHSGSSTSEWPVMSVERRRRGKLRGDEARLWLGLRLWLWPTSHPRSWRSVVWIYGQVCCNIMFCPHLA